MLDQHRSGRKKILQEIFTHEIYVYWSSLIQFLSFLEQSYETHKKSKKRDKLIEKMGKIIVKWKHTNRKFKKSCNSRISNNKKK